MSQTELCRSPPSLLLTVQQALGPLLRVQVGLVLLIVKSQQTLLVAEVFDLPPPVDGFQQLPLTLAGMAPSCLKPASAGEKQRVTNHTNPSKCNTTLSSDRRTSRGAVSFPTAVPCQVPAGDSSGANSSQQHWPRIQHCELPQCSALSGRISWALQLRELPRSSVPSLPGRTPAVPGSPQQCQPDSSSANFLSAMPTYLGAVPTTALSTSCQCQY